jgi:hypothetical protein
METVIHVAKLTPSTLTRPRGEAVGKKVAACVQAGAVELDFSTLSPSLSFLDGLVLTLQEKQVLHRVTFVTTEPVTHHRLVRIAGERNVSLLLREGKQSPSATPSPVQSFEIDERLEQAQTQSKFAQI